MVLAVLAWDVARREIARRRTHDTNAQYEAAVADLAKAQTAMTERIAKCEAFCARNDQALIAGVNEMKQLLAPVRRVVLKAAEDDRPRQQKAG